MAADPKQLKAIAEVLSALADAGWTGGSAVDPAKLRIDWTLDGAIKAAQLKKLLDEIGWFHTKPHMKSLHFLLKLLTEG